MLAGQQWWLRAPLLRRSEVRIYTKNFRLNTRFMEQTHECGAGCNELAYRDETLSILSASKSNIFENPYLVFFVWYFCCRLCQYLSSTQVLPIEHNLSYIVYQRANRPTICPCMLIDFSDAVARQSFLISQTWLSECSMLFSERRRLHCHHWQQYCHKLLIVDDSVRPRSAIISSDWIATPYLEAAESFSEQGHALTQVCILVMPWRARFQWLQYDAQKILIMLAVKKKAGKKHSKLL